MAHSTLYIIRHNYTDSGLLDLLNDVQQKNILPKLNIIFNGIATKKILGYTYGQTYGYGYGYGYGYAEKDPKRKNKGFPS